MGAVPLEESGHALEAPWGLSGASFYLDEASVTGTETALLAAAAAKGRTEIRHAAMEPHVVELCRFLRAMGVSIEGEGTSTIRVEARPLQRRHASARWRLHRSRKLGRRRRDYRRRHRGDGARWTGPRSGRGAARRWASSARGTTSALSWSLRGSDAARRITTGLWPGFPSDMVEPRDRPRHAGRGATLVHDWMYELRLFALEQLSAMRADLFLCDPHRIIISGVTKLQGPSPRQPGHPVGDGTDRCGACRGRGEPCGHRSRPSSAATERWSNASTRFGAASSGTRL